LRQRMSSIQRRSRNCRRRIAFLESCGQLGRFRPAPTVAQEFVNIHQAGPGKDALIAHMSKACLEEAQQFNLQISLRTEIGMPAFAGENVVSASVPEKPGFSQSSSGRDDSLIAHGGSAYPVQRNQV